jgi:two-component system, sensor histidine kinase
MSAVIAGHVHTSPSRSCGEPTRQILNERIAVIYRYQPALLIINAVVSAAMVYGLREVVSHDALFAWGVAAVAALALRTSFYVAFRRASEVSSRILARGAVICSATSGALWGSAGVFLFPGNALEYQLFILFVLMGMGAGAVSSLTAYLPAFYAFLPVCLLPIGLQLLSIGDPIHVALGTMTFAYLGGLTFFARTLNTTIIESLRLRFENSDLVQKLSEQRDAAERANIGKSKFLASASHDLRQPVHALALFTSALRERIHYPEVRGIVDNIDSSVSVLKKLFDALLDVSRLDSGVLQPAREHFRFADLCARLLNDYRPEAQAKGLQLECGQCDAVLYSDPTLLEQVLRNYLSNAMRYTLAGIVKISSHVVGSTLQIDVKDTGIGIPADQHGEIFKEFHQLANAERDRTKGLGLGLAIVERISRLLDHPLQVQSEPGKGSCFSIVVPLGDPGRVVVEKNSLVTAFDDIAGLCAVVVDDESDIREGMRALLDQWGCVVVSAASDDEAVRLLRVNEQTPDAILVDYRLRDERTGIEAIVRLRNEFGLHIPALIVTGDTAPERLREAKQGGYELIHKPVYPASLRAFLRNAHRHRRARALL